MTTKIQWSKGLEFVMTLMSFAVGLGNIWRFPYLCFKFGGGVFLIPYILSLFAIGYPMLYLEIALGQFTGMDCLCCWDISPVFRGVGYSGVIISYLIGVYYNVIVAQFMEYLYYSWRKTLPWTSCNNSWNVNCTSGLSSKQFFYNEIIQKTDSIDNLPKIIPNLVATYFIAWVMVFLCVIKSVKSIGKVAYVTTILPYVIITILLIKGLTLKGSKIGIKFYLFPDINKLKSLNIWEEAANQIFFSLSTCCGGVITLSSFNKYKNNFLLDTIIVGSLNSITSFYSGFAIFSATGHLAYLTKKNISQVTDSGSSLAFISYPMSISALPASQLWATIFYLMMLCLGFGTMIATAEGYIAPIENYFAPNSSKNARIVIRAVFCFVSFLCGLPMTYQGGFDYIDIYDNASSSGFLWVGLAELLCLIYIFDYRKIIEQVELMTGRKCGYLWKAIFVVITPLAVLLILISNYIKYSPADTATTSRSRGINIFLSLLCILPIPVYAIGYTIYAYIYKQNILKPNNRWLERTAQKNIEIEEL